MANSQISSGCGQSTLLRSIPGLEEITGGTIHIAKRDVTRAASSERDVAMVFQLYALYPHMTMRENMDFGMKVNSFAPADPQRRIAEAARILQLEPCPDHKPGQLSGGQRQVVVEGVALGAAPAGTVKLGIRPEHLVLRPAGQGQLAATVAPTETLGGDAYLYVRLAGGQSLVVRAEGGTAPDHGAVIGLDLPPHRQHHFAADGRTLATGGVAA